MKRLLLLALLLTLPACVAPPIVAVASLALSGVSYVETGKTLPDHALSTVSQRDCIMFRAAKGEQVCQVGEPDIAVTGGAVSGHDGATVAAPSDGTRPVAPALPVGPVTVAALAPPPASATPAAPVADRRAPGFAGQTAFDASVEAPTVAPTVTPSLADALFAAMPAETAPSPVAVVRRAAAEPTVEPTLHLVVGSFRDRARAVVHVANLAGEDLRIVETTVKNRIQYRVVAGPFAPDDIGAARAAFAAQGVKGSWALRLASDAPIQVASR